ncbi:zinc finger protein 185 isoform X3 [Stigmatopora argus]
MATSTEKASVLRTTKVKTRLKEDGSWLNRNIESEDQPAEEKPWLAELRARRENGEPTSPVTSPTSTAPPKSDNQKGVFNKPVASPTSTSNGISGESDIPKRPLDSYKKSAPPTVKPATQEESGISSEEQVKRTAEASKVLNKSAPRQRSYVLSAAKKFESQAAEASVTRPSAPFVAKRVEITDDDDDTSARTALPSPDIPVTSVASVPQPPNTNHIVNSSVKTTVVTVNESPKVEVPPPELVRENQFKEQHEDTRPDTAKLATPLPEIIADYLQVVATHSDIPETDDSKLGSISEEPEPFENSSSKVETLTALYENFNSNSTSFKDDEPRLAREEESSADAYLEEGEEVDPTPALSDHKPTTEELFNLNSGQESELPIPPSPVRWSQDQHIELESREDSEQPIPPSPVRWSQDQHIELESQEDSEQPIPPSPVRWSQDQHIELESQEDSEQPIPPSPVRWSQDQHLELESQEESEQPIPPSPVRWSQDQHLELERYSQEESEQPIPSSPVRSTQDLHLEFESQEESEHPIPPSPVSLSQDLHSEFESTVTITTETVSIFENSKEHDPLSSRVTTSSTEWSSADPFDPYPIGTTSPNSSYDLPQPLSEISINSASDIFVERNDPEFTMNKDILTSLSTDVIPIDTSATSLSTHRSWARTWKTTMPLQTDAEEESQGVGQLEEQQTTVRFERKSKENDSPWDRWTSPSVYTIPKTTLEEDEEVESLDESQSHTVTTITTIRETFGEQEGMTMDRTLLVEAPRVPTPEPDIKKPFVYVKEYVNTTELATHNATDSINSWSSSYSSSSSSPCTYCGQLVGNDAKITLEHLNISCHPECFKCASCWKPMGDLIYNMFLHGGKVHCESCYSAVFD